MNRSRLDYDEHVGILETRRDLRPRGSGLGHSSRSSGNLCKHLDTVITIRLHLVCTSIACQGSVFGFDAFRMSQSCDDCRLDDVWVWSPRYKKHIGS